MPLILLQNNWIMTQLGQVQSFYITTLLFAIIFNKSFTSTSDEQVEKLTMEFNIHYIFALVH